MPAVLTEIGFISNPEEEAYMNSETGQQEIVDCLFKAIQTYKRQLEVIGVGFKATAQGNLLDLSLGYSHSVILAVPSELKVVATQEKGQNPIITLEGTDKQLIGQVAAKIKSLRSVEPYKGKGIRYVGEFVRRKAGKAAAK
jgi:large subunit ribosomal protein L6